MQWNDAENTLTITWPEQTDVLTFNETETGRTEVKIHRNGALILE